ncbi:hypothetical protein [Nocardia sp. SC052]|uniref:hypothetical protein n=1 Tax=Nocardia sichangensis TaxID=3385975 RepID=UPI0039A397CB
MTDSRDPKKEDQEQAGAKHSAARTRPMTPLERQMTATVRQQLALAKPALDLAEAARRRLSGIQPVGAGIAEDARRKLAGAQSLSSAGGAVQQAAATAAQSIKSPAAAGLREMMNEKMRGAILGPEIDVSKLIGPAIDTSELFGPAIDTSKLIPAIDTSKLIPAIDTSELFGPAIDTSKLIPAIDTSKLIGPAIDTSKLIPAIDTSKLIPAIDTSKLIPAIDTSKLIGPAIDTSKLIPAIDTSKLIGPAIDTSKLIGPAIAASGKFYEDIAARVNAALPRIDLSAFAAVTRVADMATAMVRPVRALQDFSIQLPHIANLVHDAWSELRQTVTSLLGCWTQLSEIGHMVAGFGRRAALRARAAALHGDHAAVAEFAKVWLGLKKVGERVLEAVIAALFDPTWEQVDPGLTLPTLNKIRKREARGHVHLIGSKAGGKELRVYSLNMDITLASGEVEPLWSLLDGPSPEPMPLEGFDDPVVERVLGQLDPVERAIATTWCGGAGISWGEAAVECGQPAEKGVSVSRKLRRLGRRFQERQQQRAS